MKRFIVSALCVSVFFLGLGTLIEKVGARFKSDEKALELIRAAKTAIGGDNSLAGIQSLRIKGTTSHTFKHDGTELTVRDHKDLVIDGKSQRWLEVRDSARHTGWLRSDQVTLIP